MRRLLAPALVSIALISLSGCASSAATPQKTPSAGPASSPSPTSPPTEGSDPLLVVSLDGISLSDAEGTSEASFDDATALLELLDRATGGLPEAEPLEGPSGYDMTLEAYTWDGLRVIADSSGEGPARVVVTATEVAGVPVATDDGLHVGSTRDELLAAGAQALVDTDDPATATELGMGAREIPGTESLTRPGAVGVQFSQFILEADAVTMIHIPADDFSDL